MGVPSCGGKTDGNGDPGETTSSSGDGDSGDSGSTTTGDGDGDTTTSGSTTSTSGDGDVTSGDGDGDTSTGGDGDGDGDGEVWVEIARLFARIEPIADASRFAAGRPLELASHRITLRWRAGVPA